MPYFAGYGKNVELAAVAGALAAGAATQAFVRSRRGLLACALLAAAGLALAAARSPVSPLLAGWPQLLAVAALATSLGGGRCEAGGGGGLDAGSLPSGSGPGPSAGSGPGPDAGAGAAPVGGSGGRGAGAGAALLAALLVGALAGAAFAVTVGPRLVIIDTFHDGEVLSTAVDLLRGGRPFKTLLWPHGFHDTGLTALWIAATGKIGTSPVALAWASCCGLGVIAVYVVARRALGSRREALAATCVAACAPLVVDPPHAAGAGAGALYEMGELLFVVLGFAAVTSRRRDLAAGVCFGLAYLFRIEAAVYGMIAALGVIAYRDLLAADEPLGTAAGTAARGAFRLFAGAALALGAARLIVGWPGAEWYAYTLRELPRFHRDAVGLPSPWPDRGGGPAAGSAWLSAALARLLLTLLLLVQALRRLPLRRLRRRLPLPPARLPGEAEAEALLIFVALFTAAATKSALDRSDPVHVLQFSALPLLATVCLAAAAWRERLALGRTAASAAVLLLVASLDFEALGLRLPVPHGAAAIAATAGQRWQALAEHLAPNPPAGACADRTFTPGEGLSAVNRGFIADTCAVEALLRAHGVSRLVIADAAPFYYVRFHLPSPTRYFALARAYTPPRQFELIEELRRSRPQALLRPRGYGARWDLDIPDAVRVPVADAYLRGRRHGVALTPTPLGDLYFWDEPEECGPGARPGGGRGGAVEVQADLVTYQPASGFLYARGWAIEAATQRPLAALALGGAPPGAADDLELGLDRADVAQSTGREALRHAGWELTVRGWPGPSAPAALTLDATAAPGAPVQRLTLALPALYTLGPLRGAEWNGLAAALARAAAMGRADRAAALRAARLQGPPALSCGPSP